MHMHTRIQTQMNVHMYVPMHVTCMYKYRNHQKKTRLLHISQTPCSELNIVQRIGKQKMDFFVRGGLDERPEQSPVSGAAPLNLRLLEVQQEGTC